MGGSRYLKWDTVVSHYFVQTTRSYIRLRLAFERNFMICIASYHELAGPSPLTSILNLGQLKIVSWGY